MAKEATIDWVKLIKRNKKPVHRGATLRWRAPPSLPPTKVYTSNVEWREPDKSEAYMKRLMVTYGQGDVTFDPVNRKWKGMLFDCLLCI